MDESSVFYDVVVKEAASLLSQSMRWLSNPGRAALVGGAAGAAYGAVAKRDDEPVLGAALRGGLRGAVAGGAAGGLARAYRDTKLLTPGLSTPEAIRSTAARMTEGVKRFGQRQIHGFTGAYSDQPASIGLRSSGEAARRIELLKARHTEEPVKNLGKKIEDLHNWGHSGDEAVAAGVTSIPGIAKGLVKNPGRTVRALGHEITGGGGGKGIAMSLGVPLAVSAPDLARGDESRHGGRSMREKLVGVGSGVAGGVLTAGMPTIPNLVGGAAVDAAASHIMGKRRLAKASREAGQKIINQSLGVPENA